MPDNKAGNKLASQRKEFPKESPPSRPLVSLVVFFDRAAPLAAGRALGRENFPMSVRVRLIEAGAARAASGAPFPHLQ